MRELLASAMLEALGVDTSKTFSLIETGEELARNDEPSPTRSSVLVRLSHSHIRIGTFQRLAYHEDRASLSRLLDHAVATYLPEAWREDEAARAVAFLERVCALVARTGAQWIAAGFVHGVLNTDNINITGESFDYGPWRFLPTYDPGFTAAYFDESGLYSFGRQPATLLWNLTRLAECLLPLAPQAELETALASYQPAFRAALAEAVLARLGLRSAARPRTAPWSSSCSISSSEPRPRSSVPSSIGAAASRARSAPPAARRRRSMPVRRSHRCARQWRRSSRKRAPSRTPTSPGRHPARC